MWPMLTISPIFNGKNRDINADINYAKLHIADLDSRSRYKVSTLFDKISVMPGHQIESNWLPPLDSRYLKLFVVVSIYIIFTELNSSQVAVNFLVFLMVTKVDRKGFNCKYALKPLQRPLLQLILSVSCSHASKEFPTIIEGSFLEATRLSSPSPTASSTS